MGAHRKASDQRKAIRSREAQRVDEKNVDGRWGAQILRVESNRDGLVHTSPNLTRQRVNAYGRIPITAKWDGLCQAVKLGVVCGNEIKKGRRCFFEPIGKTLECRECWT